MRRRTHPGILSQKKGGYWPDVHRERDQLGFLKSKAKNRLIFGGNQCQRFDEPTSTGRGIIPAAFVQVGDEVIGGTVTKVFHSPVPDKCWTINCEGGLKLTANSQHPVMTPNGWKSLRDLEIDDEVKLVFGGQPWTKSALTPDDAYFTGLMVGNGSYCGPSTGLRFSHGDKETRDWVRSYVEGGYGSNIQSRREDELAWCSGDLKRTAIEVWGWDPVKSPEKTIPPEVFKSEEVARQYLRGYTDADGCVHVPKSGSRRDRFRGRSVIWISASEALLRQTQQLLLQFGVYSTLSRRDKELNGKMFEQWRLRARGPYADRFMLRVGCGLKRKRDVWKTVPEKKWNTSPPPEDHRWIRVLSKEYAGQHFVVGFTVDPTNEYVTNGILSHNSGKSRTIAQEIKWWLEESHPFQDTPKAPAIYVLSANYQTLKQGIYRHLKSILFEWEIDRWGPIAASSDIRQSVHMRNGAYAEFISADGAEEARRRVQAAACDLVVVDEEISGLVWEELISRRLSTGGRAILGATLVRSEQWIIDLENRGESGDPAVDLFRLNTRIAMERGHVDKDLYVEAETYFSDEDQEVRLKGHSRKRQGLVYPEFGPAHVIKEPVKIPVEWTRYMAIDPGFRTCALLWFACAPDDSIICYREGYFHSKTYRDIGEYIFEAEGYEYDEEAEVWKVGPETEVIHVRWIDPSGFQHSPTGEVGVGSLLAADYGIYCSPARNSVHVGIEKVKQLLMLSLTGVPRLRFFSTCRSTIMEFGQYRWLEDRGSSRGNERADQPLKRNDHAMDAMRYFAMGEPRFQNNTDEYRRALAMVDRGDEFRGKPGTDKLQERMDRWWLIREIEQRQERGQRHPAGLGNVY